jgi:DNA-binding IscR family transcriptional regulator
MGRCTIQRKMAKLEEGFLQSLAQLTIAELSKDIRATLPKKKKTEDAPQQ